MTPCDAWYTVANILRAYQQLKLRHSGQYQSTRVVGSTTIIDFSAPVHLQAFAE